MNLLNNYIKENCDPKLNGLLSFSIKEGYTALNKLIQDNKLLQLPQARNAYGHIRNVCVNIAIEKELERQDIESKVEEKQVSSNGYKYPVIEVQGAIMTAHKIFKPHLMPHSAWYRTNRSYLNRELSLFDDENLNMDLDNIPYIMITYGGLNYGLNFVQLALPNEGVNKWIDRLDIMNAPYLIASYNNKQRKELELSFTRKVEEILERENRNESKI